MTERNGTDRQPSRDRKAAGRERTADGHRSRAQDVRFRRREATLDPGDSRRHPPRSARRDSDAGTRTGDAREGAPRGHLRGRAPRLVPRDSGHARRRVRRNFRAKRASEGRRGGGGGPCLRDASRHRAAPSRPLTAHFRSRFPRRRCPSCARRRPQRRFSPRCVRRQRCRSARERSAPCRRRTPMRSRGWGGSTWLPASTWPRPSP